MAGPQGEQDWYLSGVFAMAFINLDDTFGDYVDRAGKVPKVNSVEDALEPSDTPIDDHATRHESGGADEVTGITDKLDDHSARHEDGGADEVLHNSLALGSADHHSRYADSEAVSAVENANIEQASGKHITTDWIEVETWLELGDAPGILFPPRDDCSVIRISGDSGASGDAIIDLLVNPTGGYCHKVFDRSNNNSLMLLSHPDGELTFPDGVGLKHENINGVQSVTVSLGGDFDADQYVKCTKAGDQVTISSCGVLQHADTANPISAVGVIPSAYRPAGGRWNAYLMDSFGVCVVSVRDDGTIECRYRDWSGSTLSISDTRSNFDASYNLGA